ncbi:MAG: ATP-binding response regulator [Arenicella sp.]
MTLSDSKTQKLKKLLLASTKPAYFVTNAKLELLEWSENIQEYGYVGLSLMKDCSDNFDFLVGYPIGTALDLPIVTSPSGIHVSISILPEDDKINVLIMDATQDFQKQFMLQQKANEAELLSARQRLLMKELFATQKELARKNQQLEEASRLQTRFLSGVSHEFRTPLTSIIGYSDALQEKICERDQKQLSIVQSNAKYLLALVENLLDHGRLDSAALSIQPKVVDIGVFFETVQQMLLPIAEQKEIGLHLEAELADDLQLYIDETRVQQCLVNIINNAIKFTDYGSVTIKCNWVEHELTVAVEDTGIGMSETDRENMFVSFWQSEEHDRAGTGLGLTITQRLLDLMGGDLLVASEPGQGTTITMAFPAAKVSAQEQELINVEQSLSAAKKTVLLVEDDQDIAALVEMHITDWGYELQHVNNGQLAVEWVKEHEPDLILMDLNMPVMGGLEAIKCLREQGCQQPVYIMSAKVLDERNPEHLGSVVDGHILKPIDFSVLRETLQFTLMAVQQEGGE